MKITPRQAAEILGISPVSVRTLIKQGKLTNIAADSSTRKHKLLDAKQVKELKAELKPLSRRNIIQKDNGGAVTPLNPVWTPANQEQADNRMNRSSVPLQISERLRRIEERLEYLISIWS